MHGDEGVRVNEIVFLGGPLAGHRRPVTSRQRRYCDENGLRRSEEWVRTHGRYEGFYVLTSQSSGFYRWVPNREVRRTTQ